MLSQLTDLPPPPPPHTLERGVPITNVTENQTLHVTGNETTTLTLAHRRQIPASSPLPPTMRSSLYNGSHPFDMAETDPTDFLIDLRNHWTQNDTQKMRYFRDVTKFVTSKMDCSDWYATRYTFETFLCLYHKEEERLFMRSSIKTSSTKTINTHCNHHPKSKHPQIIGRVSFKSHALKTNKRSSSLSQRKKHTHKSLRLKSILSAPDFEQTFNKIKNRVMIEGFLVAIRPIYNSVHIQNHLLDRKKLWESIHDDLLYMATRKGITNPVDLIPLSRSIVEQNCRSLILTSEIRNLQKSINMPKLRECIYPSGLTSGAPSVTSATRAHSPKKPRK